MGTENPPFSGALQRFDRMRVPYKSFGINDWNVFHALAEGLCNAMNPRDSLRFALCSYPYLPYWLHWVQPQCLSQ